jgi:hypothetical protein
MLDSYPLPLEKFMPAKLQYCETSVHHFLSGILRKNNGYGKTIDAGTIVSIVHFRDHRK